MGHGSETLRKRKLLFGSGEGQGIPPVPFFSPAEAGADHLGLRLLHPLVEAAGAEHVQAAAHQLGEIARSRHRAPGLFRLFSLAPSGTFA